VGLTLLGIELRYWAGGFCAAFAIVSLFHAARLSWWRR
jgi:hypothetical protein